MHGHLARLLAAGVVLMCCRPLAAQFITSPPPLWTESVVVRNVLGQEIDSSSGADETAPGVIDYSSLDDSNQVVSQVQTGGETRPIAQVLGHIDGTPDVARPSSVASQAYIRYSFMVVPREEGTDQGPIPVLCSSRGHVSWDGSQNIGRVTARVKLTVDGNQGTELIAGTNAGPDGPTEHTLEYDSNLVLGSQPVGSEHTLELLAYGEAFLNSDASAFGEFQAILDTQVFIDPGFGFADEYMIVFNTPYVMP